MKRKIVGFRIEEEIWRRFKIKYQNASLILREWIIRDLEGSNKEKIKEIKAGDWQALKACLDSCLQVVGDVGAGKTLTVKELIKNSKEFIFIVFDSHNEYSFLPKIEMITSDISSSARIEMPKEVSASKGLFPVYSNQILSRKWPNNFVFVIEEAHRYKKEVKLLLSEARKFAKIIVVNQEPIAYFTPIVKVVNSEVGLNNKNDSTPLLTTLTTLTTFRHAEAVGDMGFSPLFPAFSRILRGV